MAQGHFESINHVEDWPGDLAEEKGRHETKVGLTSVAREHSKRWVRKARTIPNQDGDIQVFKMVQE